MNPTNPSSVDATPEQLSMARRIASSLIGNPDVVRDIMAGDRDDDEGVQAALAAIIETTEAAASFCNRWLSSARTAARALRNNDHLKG